MSFTIREATPIDAEAIVAIHVACWQTAYRGLMPDEILNSIDSELWLTRRRAFFERPGCVRKVALREGAIIGFSDGGPCRESRFADAGEVYSLYVRPGEQGGGVGAALFRAVSAELRARGYSSCLVKTLLNNPKSRAFYEKMGCTFAGESSFELGGKRFPEAMYLLS